MAKEKKIKAIAKFNRNYASNFAVRAGQECEVPDVIFRKHPNHFIVQMTDKDAEKLVKANGLDIEQITNTGSKKPETAAEKKVREKAEKEAQAEADATDDKKKDDSNE